MELIEKLSALVPPPRKNIVHYHGVLAPHAKDRDRIVPARKNTDDKAGEEGEVKPPISMKHRLTWAALMARVYHLDVETCPRCGGKMRMVAALTDPSSIRRYLLGVGLSAEIPEIVPAKPLPQEAFVFV